MSIRQKNHKEVKISQQRKIVLLVSAWLNTSKDPITGVEQQIKQLWARVHAYFVENGENLNNRSQISVSSRWQEINREIGKFVGFVTQIENRQQSGMTEESRVILIFISMLNYLTHILTLFILFIFLPD